jgi:hypothetical protein
MNNPLNDLAPYPRTESEVTAESLLRSLMVQAQANRQRMIYDRDANGAVSGGNRLIDVYGLVKLLKEWLHAWLVGAGIDPERVNAAAADAMRDAA